MLRKLNSCIHASDCLRVAMSPELGLSYTSTTFQAILRYRSLTPFHSKPTACPGCAASQDVWGDHALCCHKLGIYARHTALRDALAALVDASGYHTQKEQRIDPASEERQADILVHNWRPSTPAAVDVSVVHPLKPSTSTEFQLDAALKTREEQKYRHADAICRIHGVEFTPFVGDTHGRWGDAAQKFASQLITRYAKKLNTTNAAVGQMFWRVLAFTIAQRVGR
jgi:hypothetical protein